MSEQQLRWRSSKSELHAEKTKTKLKKMSEERWARVRGLKVSGNFEDHRLRIQFGLSHDELALILVYPTKEDWVASKDLN